MSDPFDGLALEVAKPSRMTIISPLTDAPLNDASGAPAYLDILGVDSEPALKVDRDRSRALTRQVRRGRAGRDDEDEDFLALQSDKLAAVVAGWHLVNVKDGSVIEVPCSPDNVRKLFSNPAMGWLRRQAWVHHITEANFSGSSSKISASSPSTASD